MGNVFGVTIALLLLTTSTPTTAQPANKAQQQAIAECKAQMGGRSGTRSMDTYKSEMQACVKQKLNKK